MNKIDGENSSCYILVGVIILYRIRFYKDKQGKRPVVEYLKNLRESKNERDRKQAEKINDYIQTLKVLGKAAGLPYVRHIGGELWELRPARDRILFFSWIDNQIVLLHQFTKKTQKTPRSEIDKAMREIAQVKESGLDD